MHTIERQFTRLEGRELHRVRTITEYEEVWEKPYRTFEGGIEFDYTFNTRGEENEYISEYLTDEGWKEIDTLRGYENAMEYIKEWENTTEEWGI